MMLVNLSRRLETSQYLINYTRDKIEVVCVTSVQSDSLWPPPQVHLSVEFSSQEYWSGLPFPSPGFGFLTQGSNLHVSSCFGRQVLYHCATWDTQNRGYSKDIAVGEKLLTGSKKLRVQRISRVDSACSILTLYEAWVIYINVQI